MSRISMIKDALCFALGAVGAFISAFFGGWDAALTTLMIFMIIDYATGMIVAAVFHRSEKTASGTLESRAGWKGLTRKCMTLLFVLIAHRLDLLIGTSYIKDMVAISFCVNELISITENAGLMGIPLPPIMAKAIDILTDKIDTGNT
jgi:toxin secretion/phage lysis holin